MNTNIKSINYSLLFSALFLLGLAAIFSYGYIGYKADVKNDINFNATILKPEDVLSITGDTNFSLNIDLESLSFENATNEQDSYIDSTQSAIISLDLDPNKYKTPVTCNYEFTYEPITEYIPSLGSDDLVELGFEGECENCLISNAKFGPVSIGGIAEGDRQKIYEGSITSDSETGQAEQKWNLHYRFYNLDLDQSSVIGQNPSGKIIIKGLSCKTK